MIVETFVYSNWVGEQCLLWVQLLGTSRWGAEPSLLPCSVRIEVKICRWKDDAYLLLRSSRSLALMWLPQGLVLICTWTIINTPRRDNPTANRTEKLSHECKRWIVVGIDLPLAMDRVSPRPSRLANVKYWLVRLALYSEISTVNKYAINYTCCSKSTTN